MTREGDPGEPQERSDIEFVTQEKTEIIRKAQQVLDVLSKNMLVTQAESSEPLTKAEMLTYETKTKQLGIDEILMQVSRHLANISSFCDGLSQEQIGQIQYMLKSSMAWWLFQDPSLIKRVLERVTKIGFDYSRRPFRLIDRYLPPPGNPSIAWKGMLRKYKEHAREIFPELEAILSGDQKVTPQGPFSESWIAYALYWEETESPVPLEKVIANADILNHVAPNAQDLAWAFLRLRKRDWLIEKGPSFELTPEGRRSIRAVVGPTPRLPEAIKQLEEWMASHPP